MDSISTRNLASAPKTKVDESKNLGKSIHQHFAYLGGFDLSLIEREPIRDRNLFEDL